MLEDTFDDIGIVDECDDAHSGTAVGTFERIDHVDFLNQPGPVGLAPCAGWRLVDSG